MWIYGNDTLFQYNYYDKVVADQDNWDRANALFAPKVLLWFSKTMPSSGSRSALCESTSLILENMFCRWLLYLLFVDYLAEVLQGTRLLTVSEARCLAGILRQNCRTLFQHKSGFKDSLPVSLLEGYRYKIIILIDIYTHKELFLLLPSWPTFPLSGKWGDFVDHFSF